MLYVQKIIYFIHLKHVDCRKHSRKQTFLRSDKMIVILSTIETICSHFADTCRSEMIFIAAALHVHTAMICCDAIRNTNRNDSTLLKKVERNYFGIPSIKCKQHEMEQGSRKIKVFSKSPISLSFQLKSIFFLPFCYMLSLQLLVYGLF